MGCIYDSNPYKMIEETRLREILREELLSLIADEYLTGSDACRVLKISINTLKAAVKRGDVRARVINGKTRYLRSDLLKAGHEKYSMIKIKQL
jgi:hypothetical protein